MESSLAPQTREKKRRKHGECPKCGEHRELTRHHVRPVRFWGRLGNNDELVYLCWSCHSRLEELIARSEGRPRIQLPQGFYSAIVEAYLT